MKEEKKRQLKEHIFKTRDLLLMAQECLRVVEYLSADGEPGKESYYKNRPFFFFSNAIFWRTAVLELCKLFSPKRSEGFNFNDFIRHLKKDGHYSEANISPSLIQQWETAIEAEQPHIANLIDQRDKVYAHSDKQPVANMVSIKAAWRLIEIGQSIIEELYPIASGTSILMTMVGNAPRESLADIIGFLVDRDDIYERYEKSI